MTTVVYTDGACIPNPGPGGWAWAVPGGPYASGHSSDSTNQRIELIAALEAMRALTGPVEVRSDSSYVVKCFTDRWWAGWEARGWKNSKKQPVENQDLWRPMIELYHQRENELTFTWVKGHSDDPMNDLVDRLAVEAANTQRARAGHGIPSDVGPADTPMKGPTMTASPLAGIGGWPLVVAGHKAQQLGGFGADNPTAKHIRSKLAEVMSGFLVVHSDLTVLTGLDLGAPMLAAEGAAEAGVPYVAVLPFPDPDAKWPESTRARYRRLVAGAVDAVTLSNKRPRTPQEAGRALGIRNTALGGGCSRRAGRMGREGPHHRRVGQGTRATCLRRRLDPASVLSHPATSPCPRRRHMGRTRASHLSHAREGLTAPRRRLTGLGRDSIEQLGTALSVGNAPGSTGFSA